MCVEQRVEAALGCVVCLARWMTNGRFRPQAVWFAHAPRAEVGAYEVLLGCPVRFNQPANGVAFAPSELGLGLIQAGRELHAHLRKLAAEGISFKGLREALLYDLAVQALRGGQAPAPVGEKLGFSDENAFSRAFRRWSGTTPAQFVRAGAPAKAPGSSD